MTPEPWVVGIGPATIVEGRFIKRADVCAEDVEIRIDINGVRVLAVGWIDDRTIVAAANPTEAREREIERVCAHRVCELFGTFW